MDEKDAALAALTGAMFADEIATGAIVVDDPTPAPAPAPPVVRAAAPVEQTPAPAPAPEPVAVAEPEPEPEPATVEAVPTFKPKLDDDLQALLDEPDFEEDARAEIAAELEDGDEYSYEDPEAAARLRALEKRNQFLESQLVAKSKRGWIEEAKRAYPDLARWLPGKIEGVDAGSRRAFLRQVDQMNTEAQTVFAPALAKLEAQASALAASATEVAREEVAAAWGKPAGDTLPPAAAAKTEALERARKKGDLGESIKVLMEDHPVL